MPVSTPAPKVFQRPQPLSDHVYEQLKALIIANEVLPGESLTEERIAAQWGISRTPLRTALARLEQDGLVQTVPYRGRIVSEIRLSDLHDVYQVRAALELAAVEAVTPIMPEEALTVMAASFAAIAAELAVDRYDLYIPSDAAFHTMIKLYLPNRLLVQMLESIQDQVSRIRNFSHAWQGDHMREAFAEHTVILAAMQRRDAAAAGRAMRHHLQNVAHRAATLLRETPAAATPAGPPPDPAPPAAAGTAANDQQ